MIDTRDDLGTAKPPYRVVAAIAVHGRLPLLEHTIRRLYQKNGCVKVVCSGDGAEEKELCLSLGAAWTPRRNKPLGQKWNSAFEVAKDYNPDAVVFVGSSDWLSDNWFPIMRPYVDTHGFAGVPGCYLADLAEKVRLCHWPGYAGCRPERAHESIGIGRMLSRRLLEAIDWQPFNPILDNSLDSSMKDKARRKGFTDFMVNDHRLKAMSISTNVWINKHEFEAHWSENGKLKSERITPPHQFLSYNFPEVYEIFKHDINENKHSSGADTKNSTVEITNGVQNLPL